MKKSKMFDFVSVYFPYCIEKRSDGTWAILNREYKPVGFNTRDYIQYEDYPVLTNFHRIRPETFEKLSHNGRFEGDRFYLYDDASNPSNSDADMSAYLTKLKTLARLKITCAS